MYDYKFREKNISFAERKGGGQKTLLVIGALLTAAAILYGILELWPISPGGSGDGETDSNIIELPLPPPTTPDGGVQHADSAPAHPTD